MLFSAARLTIYAVLSAIETDLRQLIKAHLDGQKNYEELLGADVLRTALGRLQKDQDQPTGNQGNRITQPL